MLWNIWLARNRKVFKDKESTTRNLCNKAMSLALETISVKNQRNINIIDISVEERNFIGYLLDKNNSNQNGNTTSNRHNNVNHKWKIRLKEEEFSIWFKNYNSYYLFFFYGSSKSNLGIAGAGGVIFNANGERIVSYEWGLGPISNNRAEALALYHGLIQLSKLGIDTALIFGDLAVVISLMAQNRKSPNVLLQQTISRCQILGQSMTDLRFNHILCTLNKDADFHTNKVCTRPLGSLLCNVMETQHYLP